MLNLHKGLPYEEEVVHCEGCGFPLHTLGSHAACVPSIKEEIKAINKDTERIKKITEEIKEMP